MTNKPPDQTPPAVILPPGTRIPATRKPARPAPPGPELEQLIKADRQARIAACQEEITEALARHRCILLAVPVIEQDGRIVAKIAVDVGS